MEEATASTSHRFGTTSFAQFQKELERISPNKCKDVIKLNGDSNAQFRETIASFPEYCFQFPEFSLLVQHESNIASFGSTPAAKKKDFALRPVFYARLGCYYSPHEFSLQPKAWDQRREKILEEVNAYYSTVKTEEISAIKVHKGMSCVARIDGFWYRVYIVEWIGSSALVRSADIGFERVITPDCILPLLKKFGRLPALAFKSRMADVIIDDLTVSKIEEFKNEIENCNHLVRVELVNCKKFPVLVNLYHPTLHGYNIGMKFYHRERAKHDLEAKFMKREKKAETLTKQSSAETESDDEATEKIMSQRKNSISKTKFVLHFNRLEKPFMESQMFISYVENIYLVYLHTPYFLKAIRSIEDKLLAAWHTFPVMHPQHQVPHAACGFLIETEGKQHAYRGIIDTLTEKEVVVRAVDHGWKRTLPTASSQCLRLLDEGFADKPFIHLCRLKKPAGEYPHLSETMIIRELLPSGMQVTVKCHKKSERLPPQTISVYREDGTDIMESFEEIKQKRHILHPCYDLITYDPTKVKHLTFNVPTSFSYELHVFPPFAKGNLEYSHWEHNVK